MGIVIKKGEDFSDVPVTKIISSTEVGFGIWLFKRKGKDAPYELSGLYRSGMLRLLQTHGFCRITEDSSVIVREEAGVLSEVSMEEVKGFITGHLNEIPQQGVSFTHARRNVRATKEALEEIYLRQFHLIINESALAHLYPLSKEILRDDAKTAYFPFKNGIVKVTATDISTIDYRNLDDKCVWKNHIINRNYPFEISQSEVASKFEDFLSNVTGGDVNRLNGFRSAIGYLLHNYTRQSLAVAIMLYDEEVSHGATPNGGTGKGIFAKAIREMRQVERIDGKNYNTEDRFKFQQVTEETQVIWLDDPRSNFDFSDLYSAISEGLTVEAKNQARRVFPPERSPKIIICSNTVLSRIGSSNSRRQYILEVGSHYKDLAANGLRESIEKEHGGQFFGRESWDEAEWARFYLFMLNCTRYFLDKGLIESEPINVVFNELIQRTNDEFATWVTEKVFELNIRYDTEKEFLEFKDLNYGDDPQFEQRDFTAMLKCFAAFKGWFLKVKRSNGKSKFTFLVSKSL